MELEVSEEEIKDLIAKSNDAKERAFAPYSNFKVGAALLTVDGRIFTGILKRRRITRQLDGLGVFRL